jgi:radical SAM protein with 4Fe4S-binding SPASM domain
MVKYAWKEKVKNIIDKLTKSKLPLFDRISIETFSKCNGGCSFCPVNRFDDPRKDVLMNESLFKKIILNLYDLNYKGQVILSLNNEPFLDKRIYNFAKIVRTYLPDAYISILSNGTPLNVERFKKIIDNVDELVIDNYNDRLEWHENIQTIMEYLSDKEIYKDKVKFRMRLENDILDTRAGQAKNRGWIKTLDISCLYPFISITIQVNGDVSLCCNDALSKEVVDNVENKNLEDIWYSKEYFDYRKKINSSRELISICEGCDTVDIPRGISNI